MVEPTNLCVISSNIGLCIVHVLWLYSDLVGPDLLLVSISLLGICN